MLCNSVFEGFQRGYRELAGVAIIAAMAPITWDFSLSPLVFLILHEFLRFKVFARFGILQQFDIII
jgi:hypothetical protein